MLLFFEFLLRTGRKEMPGVPLISGKIFFKKYQVFYSFFGL